MLQVHLVAVLCKAFVLLASEVSNVLLGCCS